MVDFTGSTDIGEFKKSTFGAANASNESTLTILASSSFADNYLNLIRFTIVDIIHKKEVLYLHYYLEPRINLHNYYLLCYWKNYYCLWYGNQQRNHLLFHLYEPDRL